MVGASARKMFNRGVMKEGFPRRVSMSEIKTFLD
ncbi:hypothetical protein COLO4_19802 [Corchorus olitorius]|uniref:Uncharacterized protein n=1 Tax=Corchorus olitorius TaxID=93759 RepID=A0A1R3J3C0_9ROSI|nr:hypothetical protein COLO4_19802 [Corchorus olitorius]